MCETTAAGTAVGKVFIRNNRTRVTEWRFAGRGARGAGQSFMRKSPSIRKAIR